MIHFLSSVPTYHNDKATQMECSSKRNAPVWA